MAIDTKQMFSTLSLLRIANRRWKLTWLCRNLTHLQMPAKIPSVNSFNWFLNGFFYPFFFAETIYINHMCDCGPHLDHSKIKQLSRKIGPASIAELLGKTVQSIVDVAKETKQTFSILRTRQGDGDVLVRGKLRVVLFVCFYCTFNCFPAILFSQIWESSS